MEGLTAERQEFLWNFCGMEAADGVLMSCAHAIEHYETACFGGLKSWLASSA
ncbi:hypothetical protein [Roseomonas sp. WA12]